MMPDKIPGGAQINPKTGRPFATDATVDETDLARGEFTKASQDTSRLVGVAKAQRAKAKAPEPEPLPTPSPGEPWEDYQARLAEVEKRRKAAKAAVQADALEGRTKPTPSPSPSPSPSPK